MHDQIVVLDVYEQTTEFGSHVVVETNKDTREFALLGNSTCFTAIQSPQHPINEALLEAGYESAEAHS
jgi:hypothetical protein